MQSISIVYTIYFHTWPCYFSDSTGICDYRKGKHSDKETEEKEMTKKEIAEIINSKAAEYGFELEENSMGWSNKRTGQDYINIQIFQSRNLGKTDWEKRIGCIDIEACASVSRMGGSPTTEELLKAADEIARGAKFTAELQSMGLSYEKRF